MVNNTSVQSNWAKGCIANMSSLVAANWLSNLDPHTTQGSLCLQESASKRHLDQFSRNAQHVCVTNMQTDTHTDHAMQDICCNRPYLCYACNAGGLKTAWLLQTMCISYATVLPKLKKNQNNNNNVINYFTWMRPKSVRDLPNRFRLIACFTVSAANCKCFH